MNEIVEKLQKMEQDIARKEGEFWFFALFLRENAPGVWDILAAADWIEKDKYKAIKYLSKELGKYLTGDELVQISHIVTLEKDNPGLLALQKGLSITNSITEIHNSVFFGLEIAYICRCMRRRQRGQTRRGCAQVWGGGARETPRKVRLRNGA